MGREKPQEQMDQAAIDALLLLLDDAARTLKQVFDDMKLRNVESISVRHLQKGSKAARESQEFAAMAKQCFIDHISGSALLQSTRRVREYGEAGPTALKVAEVNNEIERRREAKKGK
jgi:hypothetical protein